MKKIAGLFLLIVLSYASTYGEEITYDRYNNLLINNAVMADMDKDGIADSISYNLQSKSLVFKLSTHNFVPLAVQYSIEDVADKVIISANEGGFSVGLLNMRASCYEHYVYEPESGRFRLSTVLHDNLGNAVNDGRGTYSLDLLTGEFKASIDFYDYDEDTLVTYPDITMNVSNDPVYLSDSTVYNIPDYDFFENYRDSFKNFSENITDTDTVRFMTFNNDYDYTYFVGIQNGKVYTTVISVADEGIVNKGDIVTLKHSIVGEQAIGNPATFFVMDMAWNMERISEGNLSRFYKNNRKPILYKGVHTDYWRTETRCPTDVNYFLANTTNKNILAFLKNQGSLEVVFSEFPCCLPEQDSFNALLAEVSNVHNGKSEPVCKLILDMNGDFTKYYLYDEKTGNYIVTEVGDKD